MPDEYKNLDINIFCNDCEKKSKIKFHFYPICTECKSYNTVKDWNINKFISPPFYLIS